MVNTKLLGALLLGWREESILPTVLVGGLDRALSKQRWALSPTHSKADSLIPCLLMGEPGTPLSIPRLLLGSCPSLWADWVS